MQEENKQGMANLNENKERLMKTAHSEEMKEGEENVLGQDKTILCYMILSGVIMLTVSISVEPYVGSIKKWLLNCNPCSDILPAIVDVLFKLFHEIGIAIMISAALIFALETKHYKEYFNGIFEKRIVDLMINESYINRLNNDQLWKLREKIESKIVFKGGKHDESGLWTFLNERLSLLIQGFYFEEYDMKIVFDVEKINNKVVFVTKIHKKVVVTNLNKENKSYKIPIDASMMKIEGVDDDKLYVIGEVIVNGKDITKEISIIPDSKEINNGNSYNINFNCNKTIEVLGGGTSIIYIDATFTCPSNDEISSYKVKHPCKRYTATIITKTEEYYIDSCILVFDDKNEVMPRARKLIDKSTLSVEVNDWILPGEGMVLFYRKNETKKDTDEDDATNETNEVILDNDKEG